MDAAELAGSASSTASPTPSSPTSPPPRRRSSTPRGQLLFDEGVPAASWWVLLEGTVALVRQVGTEESVLGYMTEPGQWAGGFAAWDEFGVYFATGRAENPGRVLRLDSAELRRLSQQWFPFGAALHRRPGQHGAQIESTARQREALVALGTLSAGLAQRSTTRPPRRPARSTPCSDTTEHVLSSLAGSPPAASRREQFAALDGLRLEVSGAGAAWSRSRSPTARTSCPTGSTTTTSTRLGDRARCSPRPASTSPGASGWPRAAGDLARPGPGVGLRVPVDRRRWCRRSRRRPGGCPPWSRPCGPTPRWTAPRCRAPTWSRGSTARW